MPINTHDAEQRIRDAIAQKAAEETILTPVKEPHVPIYGFDPDGWLLYVMSRRNDCRLGGDEYVALNPETHEVLFLGVHGE